MLQAHNNTLLLVLVLLLVQHIVHLNIPADTYNARFTMNPQVNVISRLFHIIVPLGE